MELETLLILFLFSGLLVFLMAGIPVAWSLGGISLIVTIVSSLSIRYADADLDLDFNTFSLATERIYSLLESELLIALPMFIMMGHILDNSGVAEKLLQSLQTLMGKFRGGLALAVTLIGVILAASTGIIGASVVLLGILAIPAMLKQGYQKELAVGTVCSAGTLGILLPPSIMLILIADRLQLSVKDLFLGAMIPGLILSGLYFIYIVLIARLKPGVAPVPEVTEVLGRNEIKQLLFVIAPPLGLILLVLGSIFFGVATPTEASGLGAAGASVLAFLNKCLALATIRKILHETMKTMGFLFAIFIGATCFSLVLRLLGGDDLILSSLNQFSLGPYGYIFLLLGFVFILGLFLDWIEITLIILPIVSMLVGQLEFTWTESAGIERANLIWFAILFALMLQTSFLTPPVGFALFYVKGVCPKEIELNHIYRGAFPFILLQLVALVLAIAFPKLIIALPASLQ